MSNKLGLVTKLVRQNARRFTTSQSRLISREEVEKIQKKQAHVQSQDEPIHLIAGRKHFYITSVLSVIALGCTAHSIYQIFNH